MLILARLNAKNRPKSPFSIGVPFSIVSEFIVSLRGLRTSPAGPAGAVHSITREFHETVGTAIARETVERLALLGRAAACAPRPRAAEDLQPEACSRRPSQ
jgi:hypothetical protein